MSPILCILALVVVAAWPASSPAGPGVFQVDPNTVEFGNARIGGSEVETITFTNTSTNPVTVLNVYTEQASSGFTTLFSGDTSCAGVLQPGESCWSQFVYAPVAKHKLTVVGTACINYLPSPDAAGVGECVTATSKAR